MAPSRTTPIGVGIIGAGQISALHALAVLSLPELGRLVAIADLDDDRASAAAHRFGIPHTLGDYRELLARDDVDAVHICTRPQLRAQMIADALRAGKHVLCEKPMARNLTEADAIVEAAEAHPRQLLSFVHQWRQDVAVRRTGALLEDGTLGRVLQAHAIVRAFHAPAQYEKDPTRETWAGDGGGVLLTVAIHQVDLLVQLLGRPVEASARMDTFAKPIDAEDTLVGWIRFESGALMTLSCSLCSQEYLVDLEISGDQAAVKLSARRRGRLPEPFACEGRVLAIRRVRHHQLRAREWLARQLNPPHHIARARLGQLLARATGRRWLPPRSWWHTPTIREFLLAVREGAPAPVGAQDARRSLELCLGLYQSALEGGPVRFPLEPGCAAFAGFGPAHAAVARSNDEMRASEGTDLHAT
jgi:predicted dehydrogenase